MTRPNLVNDIIRDLVSDIRFSRKQAKEEGADISKELDYQNHCLKDFRVAWRRRHEGNRALDEFGWIIDGERQERQ